MAAGTCVCDGSGAGHGRVASVTARVARILVGRARQPDTVPGRLVESTEIRAADEADKHRLKTEDRPEEFRQDHRIAMIRIPNPASSCLKFSSHSRCV